MIGDEIHYFAKQLWPINRSLTGEGVRQTLGLIRNHLPDLQIHSVPSGTDVFDWTVPLEWHVSEAYIITPSGEKICDFSNNNLHLLGYSIPHRAKVSLAELKNHLYSLPGQPSAIPYVTSYYEERWGFCLTQEQLETLEDGEYEVVIDSKLFDGELNYAELIIKGSTDNEILLSTYICHPSMANNELSGPAVVTFLAKWLSEQSNLKHTYRIIFVPETIGSVAYLSFNHKDMKAKVVAGFNVSCVGDDRAYSYLPSRNGNTISDFVAKHVLSWIGTNYVTYSWNDRGSDERQYCAPGIDLPIASIMRTKYGECPEYHTSLDDLNNVVTPKGLNGGYQALRRALEILEKNKKYKTNKLCEPQMGKYDLYPTLSDKNINKKTRLTMTFISYCDGNHTLLEIADKMEVPCWGLYKIIKRLCYHKIISVCAWLP